MARSIQPSTPAVIRRCGLPVLLAAGLTLAAAGAASAAAPAALPDVGPIVLYESAGTATISWDTDKPMPSIVLIDDKAQLDRRVSDGAAVKEHRLVVKGLTPGRKYGYCVVLTEAGKEKQSAKFELDMAFNYALPALPASAKPFGDDEATRLCAAAAERIVRDTGITKGYALVYGFGTGRLAYELARRSELMIVGVDSDEARVAEARKRLIEADAYGPRITVRHAGDLAKLPLTSCFANLIVSERMLTEGKPVGSAGEIARLLRPDGGTACLFTRADRGTVTAYLGKLAQEAQIGDVKNIGLCVRLTRAALAGAGKWTHQYAAADNAAYGGEELGGADAAGDLRVQWIGRPGADFGIDRNPRMPAPLAVSGRLYHQGFSRIIAMDSYNGAVLWVTEIPALRRVNMPRDASNWCADDDRLYVAVRDACLVFDGATGKRVLTCRLGEGSDGSAYEWGYVARAGGKLYGSRVKKGSSYTDFWSGKCWYDGTGGFGTEKVCSDMLFANDAATGKPAWKYQRGLIINTAIAIGGGRVYLVESRNSEAMASPSHRVGSGKLWEDLHLVALEAETGKKIWEKPIKPAPGIVVFYLSYAKERLLVTSSAGGKYHLYTVDAKTGQDGWAGGHNWPEKHHGGHMQHPVIVEDRIFLQPRGYNLADGKVITTGVGRREGCPTYAGSKNALFYRGAGRQTAVWSIQTGKVSVWTKLRPACWLNTIPANGMFLTPEGGGGCWCGNWLQTSLGFLPPASAASFVATKPKQN